MTTAHPSEELRRTFVTALSRVPPATWFEVWRLFLDDKWFQRELERHARLILWTSGAPGDWLGDIVDEAIVLFATRLQREPDLGLDGQKVAGLFPNCIEVVARDLCGAALRRLRRVLRTNALPDDAAAAAAISVRRMESDLSRIAQSIDGLPEPERSVLRLFQIGYNLREVAPILGISYWVTYGAFRRGIEQVREDLR